MVASQWNLRWPYLNNTPLPVVNDTVPDPLAHLADLNAQRQATAQDTGWSWAANPGGMMDNPGGTNPGWTKPDAPQGSGGAAQSSGTFGAYTGDPWQNYNEPGTYAGWDYTTDPYFNAQADRPKWDLAQTGPQSETDRARVWRWVSEAVGGDPGSKPKDQIRQAYLGAIARLKRDYQANGMNWSGSPYAGYDQFLGGGGSGSQAGTATQQGGQRGTDGAGLVGNSASSGASNTAANNTQYPAGGQGQTGGSNVAGPGISYDPTAGTGTGGAGNQTPQPGQPGYAGFFNLNNPQQAVRDYINSHFGQGAADTNMFFGDWVKKLFGNLVPTIMQLTTDASGKPALDRLANLGSVLDPILFGGQGTLGGNLQNFANQAQGTLTGAMPGMDASTQADLLRNLTALRTLGTNPYMASAVNNRLDAAIGSAQDQASQIIRSGGKMPNNYSLWDYINNQLPTGYVNPFR